MRKLLPIVTAVILSVIGAFSVMSEVTYAQGQNNIHACVKPNGDVRIVSLADGCRPGETAVAWNVQGPAGTGDTLSVYDSRGVRIGPVISTRNAASRASVISAPLTRVSFADRAVLLWVFQDHVSGAGGADDPSGIQFDGPDCTGQPFLHIGFDAKSLTAHRVRLTMDGTLPVSVRQPRQSEPIPFRRWQRTIWQSTRASSSAVRLKTSAS